MGPSIPQVVQAVVDLFVSSWAHKVPQYFSLDLSERRASGGGALKERWLEGLRYAFPPPNIIQMALGRPVRWEGDLIMNTPFWPHQSWFPEIMHLVIEPSRRFRPLQWLLWRQFQRSWKASSWLLGGSHHYLCPEWHQRGKCQEKHWLLDKRYQAEYQRMFEQWWFILQWRRATSP